MRWSPQEFLDRLLALLLLPVFVSMAALLPRRCRDVWLVGENIGHLHKDNGYCFFRFCLAQGYRHVYFVAGRDAANNDTLLRQSDRVLVYGSVRHLLMLSLSSTFLYTHTSSDIIYRHLYLLAVRGKKCVFLQHGVTAFKKFHPDYQKARNEMDIFVSVSKFEQSIIAGSIGTAPSRIRITGFPRFDFLENRARPGADIQILYFPTWRDWIAPGQVDDSGFVTEVQALLSDAQLHGMLKEHRMILNVCMHTRLRDRLNALSSSCPQIRLIEFGEESVQDLLSRCHLLITDYSSVSWDFFYLGKPVLFYQFDLEDYLRERGSYVNLRKPVFGERAETRSALLALLSSCIERRFDVTVRDRKAADALFDFHDKENCRRVYEAVRELQHGN
jgi:CDP-glycerol glycerophosphotransferase (TagB/SpsB family)